MLALILCLIVIKHFKFIRMHNVLHKCFPHSSVCPTVGLMAGGVTGFMEEFFENA
jgi:hypothetical protein